MLKKDIIKHEKIIEEIKAAKIDALVRARKGEFWIKENLEEYKKVVRKYNEIVHLIKGLIEIKHYPFWMHIIGNLSIFLEKPIKYIFGRPKMKSNLVEEYWGFKRIKKEWEDDFEFTEKRIDEDYNFVGDSEKFIKKHTTLLSKAKKILSKQLKKKGK